MHPIILKWGPVTLYSYGLLLGVGFLAGAVLAAKDAERRGIGGSWMYDFFLVMLVTGVIASRALYVLLNYSLYISNPWTVLNIAEGGLSLHGALLADLLVALWFCKKKGLPFRVLADTVAPSLALGIAIARWGCFLNGCCYGVITTGPWGVLTRYAAGLRYPTQILESILSFGLFAFLWSARTKVRAEGQLFALFAMLYSVIRFFVEFFRVSSYIGPLTQAQLASLVIAVVAMLWYLSLERQSEAVSRAVASAASNEASNEEVARDESAGGSAEDAATGAEDSDAAAGDIPENKDEPGR